MKPCIVCREEIQFGASKCKVCGSYQKQWRNWLPYIGAFVALLGLGGSSAVFMARYISTIVSERTARDDVRIVTLSPESLVLYNAGDNGAFVMYLSVSSSDPKYRELHEVFDINEEVQSGRFLKVPLGDSQGPGAPMLNISEKQWRELKGRTVRTEDVGFYNKDGLEILLKKHLGADLSTIDVEGRLIFRSARGMKRSEEKLDLKGVLFEHPQ